MRARMPSQIFWSSASNFATYSLAYDACCSLPCSLCCVQFVPLCLNLHLMFFVFSASFSAIDLPSSAICSCLLSLLLFLCHALFHISSVLCCCSSSDFLTVRTWSLNSAAFCFSNDLRNFNHLIDELNLQDFSRLPHFLVHGNLCCVTTDTSRILPLCCLRGTCLGLFTEMLSTVSMDCT